MQAFTNKKTGIVLQCLFLLLNVIVKSVFLQMFVPL